jgi:hypothetical protein
MWADHVRWVLVCILTKYCVWKIWTDIFNRMCLGVTLFLCIVSVSYTTKRGPIERFLLHLYLWCTDTAIVVPFASDVLLFHTQKAVSCDLCPPLFSNFKLSLYIIMSDTEKSLAIKWSVTKIINKNIYLITLYLVLYFISHTLRILLKSYFHGVLIFLN